MKTFYILFIGLVLSTGSCLSYKLKFENNVSGENNNMKIEAVVFMTANDWTKLEAGKKMNDLVMESIKEGLADKDEGTAVELAEAGIDAANPTVAAIREGAKLLAEPIRVSVNEILNAINKKKIHTFTQGTGIIEWEWKNIEEMNGYGDQETVFVILFNRTGDQEAEYLGDFVVGIRGELNFKIDENKRLYTQAFSYNEDAVREKDGENLELIYQSVRYNEIK